jgi:superfamily I DNA/RNA helicase
MSYVNNPEDTVNSYLARSLDVQVPDSTMSLTDMAESLIRSLQKTDVNGLWRGEALHIQTFMDTLTEYVASNGNNLHGFLKHWEKKDPSISSVPSSDSVKIMTIHKSKGLDFPYVIIPFAENITLYKAGSSWCVPNLSGTQLDGVANGVYDVVLSQRV